MLRRKETRDGDACGALLQEVHRHDGYPSRLPADVDGFLAPAQQVAAWVAERDGVVAGHVALHYDPSSPTALAAHRHTGLPVAELRLVSRLLVLPAHRGTGLGRELLHRAVAHARGHGQRAVLDVGTCYPAAVALYEAQGWTRVGSLTGDESTPFELWVYLSPTSAP